jgi:hypothetical protein
MECLSTLVGLKELCQENAVKPLFYLDDAEGLDRLSLAQLAKSSNGSGKAFGAEIIDASSRFLMADIETLIPKGYGIKSSLNSFCNVCTYTSISSSTSKTGVVVKNTSLSKNAYLSIDSFRVVIQNTGTFTVVLDDGVTPKQVSHAFTAGVEVSVINIGYKTTQPSVKLYFLEPGVAVAALSCPIIKSCGCSGSSSQQSKEIQVKGLLNNTEFTTQYGFIPCASVVCSLDGIICSIVNQQPRLFGLALFYRSAAKYFSEFSVTQRNNRNASFDEDEKLGLAGMYLSLYYERLRGSQNVKGIADNMAAVLNNIKDPCISCDRTGGVSWAIG